MDRPCSLSRFLTLLQLLLASLIILIALATLHSLHSTTTIHLSSSSHRFPTTTDAFSDFDLHSLSARVSDVLTRLSSLQDHLESLLHSPSSHHNLTSNPSAFRRFIDEDVIQPLYSAHISLRLIRIPSPTAPQDPLINFFTVEETRKYITSHPNRAASGTTLTPFGTNTTLPTIGHACVLAQSLLEQYMNYDVGSYCPDDASLAQKLLLAGCDPLPRRRCLARAPKLYTKPLPINASLWSLPDDRNVRWSPYRCRSFSCLSTGDPRRRGLSKCADCFDMAKEKLRWVSNATAADFTVSDVLAVKPDGDVRVGLDVSIGTGSFAARMRERNVTILSTAMNIGAPFSETIALRGLVPLYATLSQRLPLFDNTMDLIHTGGLLDGWVDLQLLDFVLFDWDRVLRPGGLLWVDKFFCSRKDLDDYMYMFLQFRYKKHRWVVSFKSKEEVYLSALLEKPPRSV